MNTSMVSAFVIASLVGASAAWADEPGEPEANVQVDEQAQQMAPPPAPPEGNLPPPPAEQQQGYAQPAYPQQPAYAQPAQPAPDGQWTYTDQYGWIWTPYGQQYTYVYPDATAAYTYAYYPSYGWRWIASPWVLGFGASPRWGVYGPARFAWYSHPWFRAATPYRVGVGGGSWHRPAVVGHATMHFGGGGHAFHGGGGGFHHR